MFDLVYLGLNIRVKICEFNDIAPIRMCSIIDACQIKRITFPFDAISLRVADDDRQRHLDGQYDGQGTLRSAVFGGRR